MQTNSSSKTEFMVIVSSHDQPVVQQAGPVLKVGDVIIKPTLKLLNHGAHFDRCGSLHLHKPPSQNTVAETVPCEYG